jgi:hypothetical protein
VNNDAPLFLISTCETTYVCRRDVTNVLNKDILVSPPIISDGSGSVPPRAALLYVLWLASLLFTQGAKDRLPAASVPRTPAEGYLNRFAAALGSAHMRQDWPDGISLDALASAGGERSQLRSATAVPDASGMAVIEAASEVGATSEGSLAAVSTASDGEAGCAGVSGVAAVEAVPEVRAMSEGSDAAVSIASNSQAGFAGVSGTSDLLPEVDVAQWLELAASAGTTEAIGLLPTYQHADVGWTGDCVAANRRSMVLRV